MSKAFDPRTTPARADLAADFLQGQISARKFVAGRKLRVQAMVADMVAAPDENQSLQTQLLFGEEIIVYEKKNGWAWGQAVVDGYVGYVNADALALKEQEPDYRVCSLRTAVFCQPDVKAPVSGFLHCNSLVQVEARQGNFGKVSDGWVFWGDLAPINTVAPDWVEVAHKYLHAPYVWGGRSSFGLDCSALVQNALLAAGSSCPRDSDMQEAVLGEPVSLSKMDTGLLRGDLVFWPGHVGIMLDHKQFLHANAYHMATVIEPLTAAISRIQKTSGSVRSIRRLLEA